MNYYIKGDAAKADQINAAFKKLGYDTSGHIFNANSVLYFTLDGEIRATTCNCTPAIIKTHPDYKELELPIEPKFKKGETIKSDSGSWVVKEVDVENQCYVVNDGWIEFKLQDHFNLVETQPKFKVGDEIKTGNTIETIAEVDNATRSYCCESGRTIWFENQDLWHLAPKPHYDISNFKPFDKVLVRDSCWEKWAASLFSNYDDKDSIPHHFMCIDSCYTQCIPFEGNEHLLGTSDMCDERFINW